MEKRLIIAITLSILVIILFQGIMPRPKKTDDGRRLPAGSPLGARLSAKPREAEGKAGTTDEKINAPEVDSRLSPTEILPETIAKEKETTVETEKYVLTFSNIGGSIKNISLKSYTGRDTNAPLALVSNVKGDKAILAMKSESLIQSLDRQIFNLDEKSKDRIKYSFTLPGQFKIVKEYSFHNSNDYIELNIYMQNLGTALIYKDYDIIGASSIQSSDQIMAGRFLEIDSMVDGKLTRNTRVKNGESFMPGIISWTGVKEKYFSIVLKPKQDSEGIILKQFNGTNLAAGVRAKKSAIHPGTVVEDSYMLYIGPNDIKVLSKLGLGQVVDYGIFGIIAKLLLATLRMFYNITRNWGIAIILLTFLVNLILFPLTQKSFLSMKKIQDVQPHIEKLRKLHKDNPQKMNKELAELYRQYNINPLGGCLPLLVQMPIFIALYQGLIRSIELKGAKFLWIKDLSHPDYVTLPVALPILGSQIHILPLVMVVAMFFQQKLSAQSMPVTSPEQKQQQKIMLIFFPIFFGFLFYKFPSGLVLYWLTNTILMTVEHSVIRRHNA